MTTGFGIELINIPPEIIFKQGTLREKRELFFDNVKLYSTTSNFKERNIQVALKLGNSTRPFSVTSFNIHKQFFSVDTVSNVVLDDQNEVKLNTDFLDGGLQISNPKDLVKSDFSTFVNINGIKPPKPDTFVYLSYSSTDHIAALFNGLIRTTGGCFYGNFKGLKQGKLEVVVVIYNGIFIKPATMFFSPFVSSFVEIDFENKEMSPNYSIMMVSLKENFGEQASFGNFTFLDDAGASLDFASSITHINGSYVDPLNSYETKIFNSIRRNYDSRDNQLVNIFGAQGPYVVNPPRNEPPKIPQQRRVFMLDPSAPPEEPTTQNEPRQYTGMTDILLPSEDEPPRYEDIPGLYKPTKRDDISRPRTAIEKTKKKREPIVKTVDQFSKSDPDNEVIEEYYNQKIIRKLTSDPKSLSDAIEQRGMIIEWQKKIASASFSQKHKEDADEILDEIKHALEKNGNSQQAFYSKSKEPEVIPLLTDDDYYITF